MRDGMCRASWDGYQCNQPAGHDGPHKEVRAAWNDIPPKTQREQMEALIEVPDDNKGAQIWNEAVRKCLTIMEWGE